LEILEGRLMQGEVSVDPGVADRPVFIYKAGRVELPLQGTSSMVGELASLDLWIKHLIRPGDLLIIDEPEAHLHPENQRNIARVLVRLVRAGVKVICPTHSPLILHQVSNHLLASAADEKVRSEADFSDHDLLDVDEVGVYLFDLKDAATTVSPVPIEPGFGISEEEFVRVAEAIGDQSYRLSPSAPARPTSAE
jgi:predicted ATPase